VSDETPTLVEMTCAACAVVFGVTPALRDLRKSDKSAFFCPNGHGVCFPKTTVDPKDEELKDLRAKCADLKAAKAKLESQLEALTAELLVWKPRSADVEPTS
jgi:hypothetical protein